MIPEVDLSQNLLPPGYPVVTPRHVALLLATWMLARIAEVVHDLLKATQRSEAKGAAASLPVQQGEPTLKAGSSVSKPMSICPSRLSKLASPTAPKIEVKNRAPGVALKG